MPVLILDDQTCAKTRGYCQSWFNPRGNRVKAGRYDQQNSYTQAANCSRHHNPVNRYGTGLIVTEFFQMSKQDTDSHIVANIYKRGDSLLGYDNTAKV